jgi:hypothetical protein
MYVQKQRLRVVSKHVHGVSNERQTCHCRYAILYSRAQPAHPLSFEVFQHRYPYGSSAALFRTLALLTDVYPSSRTSFAGREDDNVVPP